MRTSQVGVFRWHTPWSCVWTFGDPVSSTNMRMSGGWHLAGTVRLGVWCLRAYRLALSFQCDFHPDLVLWDFLRSLKQTLRLVVSNVFYLRDFLPSFIIATDLPSLQKCVKLFSKTYLYSNELDKTRSGWNSHWFALRLVLLNLFLIPMY